MKKKLKFTGREKWLLALGPAVLVIGVYLLFFLSTLTAEVDKQRQRMVAAAGPLPPPATKPSVVTARKALDDTKKGITDRETHIAQLEARLAAPSHEAGDALDAARVIEQIGAVFARNGITPLVSEPAGESQARNQPPAALVALLAGEPSVETSGGQKSERVWHCIFDDQLPKFSRALNEMKDSAPGVIPLSMNLVYNPDNDGETRLLELWLAY